MLEDSLTKARREDTERMMRHSSREPIHYAAKPNFEVRRQSIPSNLPSSINSNNVSAYASGNVSGNITGT